MDVSSWTGMADDAAFVNALLQQALEAVKEVMGENGSDVILKEAGNVDEVACKAIGDGYCRFRVTLD